MEGDFLPFQKVREGACTPTRDTKDSAGLDLKSPSSYIVRAGTTGIIPTGLAFDIPKGLYGRLAAKSQQAYQYSLLVLGGVIDSGYTQEVYAILHVLGEEDFEVEPGENFVQLILEENKTLPPREVKSLAPSKKKTKQYSQAASTSKGRPSQPETSKGQRSTPTKKYRLRSTKTKRLTSRILCTCCK